MFLLQDRSAVRGRILAVGNSAEPFEPVTARGIPVVYQNADAKGHSGGRLDILEGTDLTEMFDFYFNDENAELDEKEEEMVFNAGDAITSILHEPAYVHNKAVHLDALIKEYLKIKEYCS